LFDFIVRNNMEFCGKNLEIAEPTYFTNPTERKSDCESREWPV